MLVAVGPLGFCLALLAFMPSLWTTALLVCAFFFAYYVYEPPYRGLYPDLLPETVVRPLAGRAAPLPRARHRRARSSAAASSSSVWEPAPFLLAALVVTAACLVPIVFVREDGGHGRVFEGVRAYLRHSWRVLRAQPRRRQVPRRQLGVGGDVRRAPAPSSSSTSRSASASRSRRRARARRGRRRVHRRRARGRAARRPLRAGAGDRRRLASSTASACSAAAWRPSGTPGTWRSSSSSPSPAAP